MPSVPVGGTAERLAPGLYLTVVHGQNIPSLAGSRYPGYLIREEIKEDEALDPSAAYRSIACTDTKIYIFQPQLIGLPSVDGLDTAGSGGWQYAVEAVTKSEIKKRYADLEITKTLSSYSDPVTFVFEVEAVPPDIDSLTPAEKANYEAGLYKWVVPIRFEGAGGQTVSIRGEIPAGWRVTVTEVYSGMAYRNTGAQPGIRPNGPGRPDGRGCPCRGQHHCLYRHPGRLHCYYRAGRAGGRAGGRQHGYRRLCQRAQRQQPRRRLGGQRL